MKHLQKILFYHVPTCFEKSQWQTIRSRCYLFSFFSLHQKPPSPQTAFPTMKQYVTQQGSQNTRLSSLGHHRTRSDNKLSKKYEIWSWSMWSSKHTQPSTHSISTLLVHLWEFAISWKKNFVLWPPFSSPHSSRFLAPWDFFQNNNLF